MSDLSRCCQLDQNPNPTQNPERYRLVLTLLRNAAALVESGGEARFFGRDQSRPYELGHRAGFGWLALR